MKNLIFYFAILLVINFRATAQKVDDFKLTNAQNGESVSLNDFSGTKAVAIFFMSTNCPFAEYYIERIKLFHLEYKPKGIEIILVNSYSEESLEQVKAHANKNRISFPYLMDRKQLLLKSLGVKKAPTAVLLKNDGGSFTKFYNGAIDNNPQVSSDVKHHYLKDNVDALLAGKAAINKSPTTMGCLIR